MSDQMNEFDQIFRDRLGDQTATPPPAVWNNIQSTRTFGHVMANKISNNWRIFGTLLMLLLAGGSAVFLFGEEENADVNYVFHKINLEKEAISIQENTKQENHQIIIKKRQRKEQHQKSVLALPIQKKANLKQGSLPEADILASLQQASAFTIPKVSDERLAAYIKSLDGWGDAKPKGYTHYYNMNLMQKQDIHTAFIEGKPITVDIDYDYVKPSVERKTFNERASFVLSITPQDVRKTLRAEYNMSSSFLENRKKAEKTRLAYSANALLHYEVKKNKFIETGIALTQIYEEVSFEGEMRFSNKYNFIEIPLLLGYEDRNSKWGWHVKGGLGVQIFNTYKGYTLKRILEFGEENTAPLTRRTGVEKLVLGTNHSLSQRQDRSEVASLEDENENPYKTSGIVNLNIATGITYFHTDKVAFLVTPSYKRSLSSITKRSANFSERISYTGVSFGTMVKF